PHRLLARELRVRREQQAARHGLDHLPGEIRRRERHPRARRTGDHPGEHLVHARPQRLPPGGARGRRARACAREAGKDEPGAVARAVGKGARLYGPLAGIAAALPLALWLRGFMVDDALIEARYAANLAAGAGYRFNAGGPVTDGVTPLGWPLLLAPFAGGGVLAAFAAAKLLGLAAWLLGAALLGAA